MLRAAGQLAQLLHVRPADAFGIRGALARLVFDLAVLRVIGEEAPTWPDARP